MNDDDAPLSEGTQLEVDQLQQQLKGRPGYKLVRAARIVAFVLAALALVELLVALAVVPGVSRATQETYERMSGLEVLALVIGALAKAFFLFVSAEILELWLESIEALRWLRDNIRTR